MKPKVISYCYFAGCLIIGACSSKKQYLDSAQSNTITTIYNKEELVKINEIVPFVSGDDDELEIVLQDAIEIQLNRISWGTIDKAFLEHEVNKDFFEKERKGQTDSTIITPLNYSQMAELVGAEYYILVNFTVGKKQYSNQISSSGQATIEKIVISTISIRIYMVGKNDAIALGAIDFMTGQSPTYAAYFVRKIIENMISIDVSKKKENRKYTDE